MELKYRKLITFSCFDNIKSTSLQLLLVLILKVYLDLNDYLKVTERYIINIILILISIFIFKLIFKLERNKYKIEKIVEKNVYRKFQKDKTRLVGVLIYFFKILLFLVLLRGIFIDNDNILQILILSILLLIPVYILVIISSFIEIKQIKNIINSN